MMHSVAPELAFAQELAGHLSEVGLADLQYTTAEMQPFSNAQKPDILFVPFSGLCAGSSVFVEIKLSTRMVTMQDYQELIDHLEFAEECIGGRICKYIFITGESVSDVIKNDLELKSIYAVDRVKTVESALAALNNIGLL